MKKTVNIVLSGAYGGDKGVLAAKACWDTLMRECKECKDDKVGIEIGGATVWVSYDFPPDPLNTKWHVYSKPLIQDPITLIFERKLAPHSFEESAIAYGNPAVFKDTPASSIQNKSDLILSDPTNYEAIKTVFATAVKRYFIADSRQKLSDDLGNYREEREGNTNNYYYGALSWLFGGVTRDAKIRAATALFNAVAKGYTLSDGDFGVHRAALSQGRLGALYKTSLVLPKEAKAKAKAEAEAEAEAGVAAGVGL